MQRPVNTKKKKTMSKFKMTRAYLFVLLVFAACFVLPVCASDLDDHEQASALMQTFFESGNSPGLSVSVGREGKILWSGGFGYADVEQQVPVDPARTLFRIGSVVKSMTAYAVAQLVKEGKLDLDAPVQKYVPDFPEKGHVITTRHLLSHLSGIRHYQGGEFVSREHYPTVTDGLVIFKNDPLRHPPGEAYLYSSYGYNLISAVIEGATQQAYLNYMMVRVFEPMGMKNTVPDFLDQIIPGRGRYYYESNGQVVNAPEVNNSYKWASGGVIGTSDDLVRFGFGLLNPELFDEEIRDSFWTMQKTDSGEETGYGLGFRIVVDENDTLWIGHGGGSIGGTTQFWIRPADGLVIAMISNLSSFNFGTVLVPLSEIFE
jgi:CubicO group peptidase (beta-lactamase class C family)